jgi:hypothetical protein
MKKLILLFSILLYNTACYSQGFYMNGRFSNTTPDLSLQIDSAAFNFTDSEYTYFINDNPAPSSFGTYMVITGGPADTLVLMEDSLGVCSVNGSGTTIALKIDKTLSPFVSITLSETTASQDSCPTHSARMSGDFFPTGGTIIDVPSSVKNNNAVSFIKADVYNGTLRLSSPYDEKASVDVININGQVVLKPQAINLRKGQISSVSLEAPGPGIYFVRIRSEHEMKVVKFAL